MGWGEEWPERLRLLLIAVLLGGCAAPLPLRPFSSNTLPDTHERAVTPLAFLDFCVRFPDQCATDAGPRTIVALDASLWQRLNTVNHAVNTAIAPQDDQAHYGRDEFWTIPTDGHGDCEDYALTKRQKLLDAGLSASALRLAVVYSIKTALHAVLTVSTDQGDLVLDNVSDTIMAWKATDFTWIMVQDKANPLWWDSLRPAAAHSGSTAGYARVSVTNLLTDPDGR